MASLKPQNAKELYNLRHASLRNVIERIFGVLMKRFPLLTAMPSYPFPVQAKLLVCIFIIHNFIRTHKLQRDKFDIDDVHGN